jgi:hypothetical protein
MQQAVYMPEQAGSRAEEKGRRRWWKSALLVLGLVAAVAYTLLALLATVAALVNHDWSDAFDSGEETVGGFIGLGALFIVWRRYGWTEVGEVMSTKGYALYRAAEDRDAAESAAKQLIEKDQRALSPKKDRPPS